MSESVHTRIIHAILSMLLAVGLLMPLLGILDPSFLTTDIFFWIAGIVLLFELVSFRRITAYTAAVLVPALLLVWMLSTNGLETFSDVVLAIVLRFRGIHTALPVVASYTVVFLTLLVTLLSCFACLRGVPVLQAACLCFAMILLIYLTGSDHMIPWFLPALAALLLMLLTNRFPETALLPLVPVAVILVAVAYLLSGHSIDPNPLHEKADEFRQAVLDRFFFTEPRDVFSLSSEGFYPEGQDQLGGKPDPQEHLVMQVSAPRTVYLRGVVFNEYTGRNWINTSGGRRYLRQSPQFLSARSILFDEDLPAGTVRNSLCDPATVSVRMLSDSASTLFVPQRVRDLIPGGDLVPYFSNSSELFITRNLKSGDSYIVSAPLFTAGDPGLNTLIEVCSTLEDNHWEEIARTYTALPDHLEEPIYAMAREASSVAVSPYDRAMALQSWLSRNFRYTLDVDWQPSDMDFVTRFLLVTREGYCTYFASAMTVLCRMVGLPSRYVEGYLAEPDSDGNATVTGLSAHAWTEVYFKGFGWLTFDATPRRSRSGEKNISRNNTVREPDLSPSPEETPSPSPQPDYTSFPPDTGTEQTAEQSAVPSDTPGNNPSTPSPDNEAALPENSNLFGSFSWLLLLIILLLAFMLRIVLTLPSVRAKHCKTETERFNVWVQEITDLLFAENLSRNASESPMAFGRRVDRSARFSVALGPVGECISLIRYSNAETTETDTGLIRDTSILLKGELSRPARMRYLLRRTFISEAKRTSL